MKIRLTILTIIGLNLSLNAQTVTDIDGNTYNTVTIGEQTWLKENLMTTKYTDGTAIENITTNNEWTNNTEPAYCWYRNNEEEFKVPHGALYNWAAINTGKLCPTGWRVPLKSDWETLISYIGGEFNGGKLKETGTTNWKSPNEGATNETGFSAVQAGERRIEGSFEKNVIENHGGHTLIWSKELNPERSGSAWIIKLYDWTPEVHLMSLNIDYGASCRCIKDDANTTTDLVSACESYTWIDGNTYTSSNNTATYTLTNIHGSDSIVQLDLTINHSNTTTDLVSACEGYTWIDGNTYTSNNNTATHTLTNIHGCDSIIQLDLTVNKPSTSSVIMSACNSYTSPSGKVWTVSDTYTDTIPNTAGCDSIITIDLTIDCFNSVSSENILKSTMYPNPADEKVIIDLEELNNRILVEIFTMTGQLLSSEEYFDSRQVSIDLNIPKGTYLIRVTNDKGNLNSYKVLKQ